MGAAAGCEDGYAMRCDAVGSREAAQGGCKPNNRREPTDGELNKAGLYALSRRARSKRSGWLLVTATQLLVCWVQRFELDRRIVSFPDLQWKQLARCHFAADRPGCGGWGCSGCGGRCCDRPADWPLTAPWTTCDRGGKPTHQRNGVGGALGLQLLGILGI